MTATIGNRPDEIKSQRDAALAYVTDQDRAGHAVYTESLAKVLHVPWAEAQAVLTDLRRRGALKYEQVEREYRDNASMRGQTYTTFRWWPRTRSPRQ